jgi:drug/metabolite transporter (DMT)-like permease
MPGSAGFGPKIRIEKRSRRELVAWIIVFPLLALGLLIFAGFHMTKQPGPWAFEDWFILLWLGVMSLGLGLGLPAAAWQELRRRKLAHREPDPKDAGPAEGAR